MNLRDDHTFFFKVIGAFKHVKEGGEMNKLNTNIGQLQELKDFPCGERTRDHDG